MSGEEEEGKKEEDGRKWKRGKEEEELWQVPIDTKLGAGSLPSSHRSSKEKDGAAFLPVSLRSTIPAKVSFQFAREERGEAAASLSSYRKQL